MNTSIKRSQGFENLSGKPKTSFSNGFNGGFGQKPSQPKKSLHPIYQRLHKIRDSFDPNSEMYKFYSIHYNIGSGTTGGIMSGTKKPPYITQETWDSERSKAKQMPYVVIPDSLTPQPVSGFKDLQNRYSIQSATFAKLKKKLEEMKKGIEMENDKYKDKFIHILERIEKNNITISKIMMEVLKSNEETSPADIPFTPQEHELFDRLQRLNNEISKPNKYKSALNALSLKSDLIKDSKSMNTTIEMPQCEDKLEEIIQSNHEAIEQLVATISKHQKSAVILDQKFHEKIQSYIGILNSYE